MVTFTDTLQTLVLLLREKQAQGLHFGLSEQGRVARGGYVGGIAFVSFRTPRASFGVNASANGFSDAVRFRPALVARGETPGRVVLVLLPASRRAELLNRE
jgi:hypothetical protein